MGVKGDDWRIWVDLVRIGVLGGSGEDWGIWVVQVRIGGFGWIR